MACRRVRGAPVLVDVKLIAGVAIVSAPQAVAAVAESWGALYVVVRAIRLLRPASAILAAA
jgi:hypothetical protein